jgi:hypothetical protein
MITLIPLEPRPLGRPTGTPLPTLLLNWLGVYAYVSKKLNGQVVQQPHRSFLHPMATATVDDRVR